MKKLTASYEDLINLEIAPLREEEIEPAGEREMAMSQAFNKRARKERLEKQKSNYRRFKDYYDAVVNENGVLDNAPCACPGCQEDGRQPGHRYCENVPSKLLAAQERGLIVANLDSAGWYWTVAQ